MMMRKSFIKFPSIWTTYATERYEVVDSRGIHKSVYSRSKRLIDIIGSLVGLFILSFMFPFVAIAIKVDSPGPILYSQERCGLNGKKFKIYKFRSMVVDAEKLKHLIKNESKGHIFKSTNDTRVTRVGHLIRKTSIDEFPQFWNVLKGEMSIVGTRPPTVNEVEKYNARHHKRLLVKPGLTGEWQVNGRSNVKDFESIVNLDLRYQRRWSLVYDLKLIVKTVLVLAKREGAM